MSRFSQRHLLLFLNNIGRPTVEELNIILVNPKHTNMSTALKRLESFQRYEKDDVVDRNLLVAAGYFFCGTEDKVTCFWCDGSLEKWSRGDDPWIEHAK